MRQTPSLTQGWNSEEPTRIDIYNTIKAVQQKYPLNFRILIHKLYQKHVLSPLAANMDKDHSFCGSIAGSQSSARQSPIFNNPPIFDQKKLKPPAASQKVSSDKEDSSLPSISSDSQKTSSSEQIQKEVIQKFKPTPTKYEVQEQFLRMKEKNQLNISGQVYDRFGKYQEKAQEKVPLKKINGQNQQNIRRAQEWDKNSNKQYRIYANKVGPRFRSRNDEFAYFQRRQFAKTFSERGYRIDRVKEVYSQKFAPENVQGRKNKTVSIGFVTDTYHRFQQFLMQDMRKNVRPLTGVETRYLYSVILTANQKFDPAQYDCFRKFAKIAFDLGSVSIYEQDAIKLFLAIQNGLKQKIESGEKIDQESFCPLPVKNIPRLDIYAPKPGGGYEEQIEIDTQSLSLELDQQEIDDQELQFIDEGFDL